MIQGQFDEIDRFWEPAHVEAVGAALESHAEEWFHRYCQLAPVGRARFSKKRPSFPARPASDPAAHLALRTSEDLGLYAKSAKVYRDFLEPEAFGDYADDLRIFAKQVCTQLPVINKALNGPLEEMVWWKKRMCALMSREPRRLYDLFGRLLEFADDYPGLVPEGEEFLSLTEPDQLALDAMNLAPSCFDEEEVDAPAGDGAVLVQTLSIPGSVSVGITSMVLHMLDGGHFAPRTRHMLAALYFLTGGNALGLRSSEFVLWSLKGELRHNHYYPYPLFMTHALRIARVLRRGHERLGVAFPVEHAMVLTASFLQFVADAHADEIATWKEESVW